MNFTGSDLPPPPKGVKLRAPEDYDSARADIYDGIHSEISSVFPQSYGGKRLELHDVAWADPDTVPLAKQKDAILKGGTISRRLQGTFRLIDEATNKPLDERRLTLLRAPHLTERGTFIDNGSEYCSISQDRLLPGAYTRRKNNGGLETQFNLKVGTGPAFRVSMDPETSIMYLEHKGSRWKLHGLLKELGVQDKHLATHWGEDVLNMNKATTTSGVLDKAYAKMVRKPDPQATREQKIAALREVFDGMRVHKRVVSRTLPDIIDPSFRL